jgi:hypothetical protein
MFSSSKCKVKRVNFQSSLVKIILVQLVTKQSGVCVYTHTHFLSL